MVINTTDVRSHSDEQIIKAADFLSGSEIKQLVFEEIYRTKNSGKTAKEIALNISTLKNRTLTPKQILDTARALDGHGYIETNKSKGALTFVKVPFFSLNKTKILHLARNRVAREKFRSKVYGRPIDQTRTLKIEKPNILWSKQRIVTKQAKEGRTRMEKTNGTWDVFISHASEDKDSIARPLRNALVHKGLKVWFDEDELTIGDRLYHSIDEGITKSGYGIVILSENFFKKDWPQRELEGLVAKEYEGRKVILPLWHNVDAAFIRSKSLLLAGLLGIPTSKGIEFITDEVMKVVKPVGQASPTPRPLIQLPKGRESRRSILQGIISSLQPLDDLAILQTIKEMDYGVLKQTYTDLLEAVGLFDLSSNSKDNRNVFVFLKEAILERDREEGAHLFELLIKWYLETATPMCKSAILEIVAQLSRSSDLKEIVIRNKGNS